LVSTNGLSVLTELGRMANRLGPGCAAVAQVELRFLASNSALRSAANSVFRILSPYTFLLLLRLKL